MKSLIAEGKTTALDLFTEPFMTDGLVSSYDIEVTPTKHTDNIIQFSEPGHPDHFIDMSQIYLSIECVIMRNGQSEAVKPTIGMEINEVLLDALVSRSVLSLNHTEIGDTSDNYARQNALAYTLGYDSDSKLQILNSVIGWDGRIAVVEASEQPSDGTLNAVGRLMTGAFSTPRLVVPEVDFDLKLKLGGANVRKVSWKDEDMFLKIQHASLTLRRVCVQPKIAQDIMSQLKRSPAVYPYHLITTDTSSVPTGMIPISTLHYQELVFIKVLRFVASRFVTKYQRGCSSDSTTALTRMSGNTITKIYVYPNEV